MRRQPAEPEPQEGACGRMCAFVLLQFIVALLVNWCVVPLVVTRAPPPAAAAAAAPVQQSPAPTAATAAPQPSGPPLLTADALRQHADPGGTLAVTFANRFATQMVLNWHMHLTSAGVTEHLVAATDDALLQTLVRRGVPAVAMRSVMPLQEAKWGSRGFMAMGQTKGALVAAVLRAGLNVMFVDADCVVLRDPRPYLLRRAAEGADVLMHSDELRTSSMPGDGLEDPRQALSSDLNTGFFWMRSTAATRAAVAQWEQVMARESFWSGWRNDQTAFNGVMKQGASAKHSAGLVSGANGTVRIGILPVHLFCSGHTYFVQRLPQLHRQVPYAVHVTFVNCDAPGKIQRLREAGLWLVEPDEYYRPAGGLLSFDMDLPAEMVSGFEPTADGRPISTASGTLTRHFELVHHQLKQLRTALAVALLANRTVVLPRLLCGLETVTNFAHSGRRCRSCGPSLPYLCPSDHVLRFHYWGGAPPSGPKPRLRTPFREHSLLESPRLPRSTLSSHVRIDTGRASPSCASLVSAGAPEALCGRDLPEPAATVRLGGNLATADSIADLVRAHGDAALWRFGSLRDVTAELGALSAPFHDTMMWLPGGWCCAQPAQPGGKGHYFYDMHWDEDHTDRWGRKFAGPFEPRPGP